MQKENLYEKYLEKIEKHAQEIIKISKEYGEETFKSLEDIDLDYAFLAKLDAEKSMILGILRYILDYYIGMGGGSVDE